MEPGEVFTSLQPLLFSIAYRMLGSVAEAEDIVQDTYLRYQRALDEGVDITSPKAYLSATVTRLAIDQLRSARARRETYVGAWLPEPLLTSEADPAARADDADSLSMAFLLLLEQLTPVERAVFLLHDIFGYEHREIAAIVGKSELNCRQLALRARRPRFDVAGDARDELARRFFAAVSQGDLDGLVAMLANDVVVYGDGGGKAPQWSAPIQGAERVARLFAGMSRQLADHEIQISLHSVNGQPGAMLRDAAGQLINVFVLDIVGGAVHAVRSVINPDKLRHLGPVADVRALLRTRKHES
jgi:RNA polymerase sigma-70 factor (ECF subfamily)